MAKLTQDAKNRLIISLTDKKVGEEVIKLIESTPLKNAYTIYVDPDGDDNGDGSQTFPYKTVSKALDQCTNPSDKYNIILGSGTYSGPTINWKGNVSCFSFGASNIQQTIQYTATDGAEEAFSFNGIGVADFQMDLTQGSGFALPVLTNGSYNITRTDITTGARFIQVSDSAIGKLDLKGSLAASNVIFLGQVDIRQDGLLLVEGSVFGTTGTLYDNANVTLISSVFPGTLNCDGGSTVTADSTSMQYGGTVMGGTLIYSDGAPRLAYTPDDGSNWDGNKPATVQEGLDRIASLLKTLNGGSPIP